MCSQLFGLCVSQIIGLEPSDKLSTLSTRNRNQKQDEEEALSTLCILTFVACCDPIDNDADLSIAASSVNLDALREVRDFKQKLHVQEDTKVELLQQLQEHSSLASCLSLLEKESNQLREEKTKIKAEYMNDMLLFEYYISSRQRFSNVLF